MSLTDTALTYAIVPYDLTAYGGFACPGGVVYHGALTQSTGG